LELNDAPSAVQWAYRRAAWAIEDLQEDLSSTYALLGLHAVRELQDIPADLAPIIEDIARAGLDDPV
jgi:hypothetical protein